MSHWVAMHCTSDAEGLQAKHPNAFLLLCQIVRRAKYRDCPITGLKYGQAFVGDFERAGIASHKAYRTAKDVLSRAGIAAFKGANKGTVATLIDTTFFSLSNDLKGNQEGNPGANKGQAGGNQGATNTPRHKDTETPKKPKAEEAALPAALLTPEFLQAWKDWKQHLKEKRKPMTPTSEAKQLAKLDAMGPERAVAAVLHSTEKGWQGIFEPEQPKSSAAQGTLQFADTGGRTRRQTGGYNESTDLSEL